MAETLVGTERLSSMERELREDHLANYLQLVAASVRPVAISLRPRPRPAAVSVSVRSQWLRWHGFHGFLGTHQFLNSGFRNPSNLERNN